MNNDQQSAQVQVVVRCRPLSEDERAAHAPEVVLCKEADRAVALRAQSGSSGTQQELTYKFEQVFGPDSSQEQLYSAVAQPLVDQMLAGFSCTLFAYGRTGSGKTHTMLGDVGAGAGLSPGAGIIPRALHHVLAALEGRVRSSYNLNCSYLELYNEKLTDLLAAGGGAGAQEVRIGQAQDGTVALLGHSQHAVRSCAEALDLLRRGGLRRSTAATKLNQQSSRSHAVFVVALADTILTPDGRVQRRERKLHLVDLAGSESVGRSGAVEQRAKEAGSINKSLLTLGRVIATLVEGRGRVPYRDSKLTQLLSDSLGGGARTCMIGTVAPTVQCREETASTLEYMHRARSIKNKPTVRVTTAAASSAEVEELKQQLAELQKKGVYVPTHEYAAQQENLRQLGALNERAHALQLEAEEAHQAAQQLAEELGMARQEREELQKLAAAQQEAQEENAQLRLEVTELQSRLAQQEQQAADGRAATASARAEVKQLQAQLREQQQLVQAAQGEAAELQSRLAQQAADDTAAAGAARAEVKQLQAQLQEQQQLVQAAQGEAAELRSRLQEAPMDEAGREGEQPQYEDGADWGVQVQDEDRDGTRGLEHAAMAECQGPAVELQQELVQRQARIEELEGEVERKGAAIRRLESDKQRLEADNLELHGRVEHLEKLVHERERENMRLDNRRDFYAKRRRGMR